MTDWGAHHLDIAQWAINAVPESIDGRATYPSHTDSYNVPIDFQADYRYPGGVIIHELGHATAFHILREKFPNLAAELSAYNIEPPFQWPTLEEELQWGDETWAHVTEAWFGYNTEFWWFWDTRRPGTGRLFDVIEMEDGRSLRSFLSDLYGPPQDTDGNEYPDAAVTPQ